MSRIAIVSRLRRRPRKGSLDVTLEEIIMALQDCTRDDGLVVRAMMEMMAKGSLRAVAEPGGGLERVVNG